MNIKDFEFKNAIIGMVIGFLIVLLIIVFKWNIFLLLLGAAVGFVIGLLLDLLQKKGKEE
jgi:uncharacterized membrane protein YccC